MQHLRTIQGITLGCDPEFFFTRNGKVIGSERIVPKDGILSPGGLTVIDGVQAELHPQQSTCRELLAHNIRACMFHIDQTTQGTDIVPDFSQVVEIEKTELDSLSDENKKFGCSSSMNNHKRGKDKVTTIKADPLKYLKRSAGGHIHLGAQQNVYVLEPHGGRQVPNPTHAILQSPAELVPVLDVLVGNTSVLLDKDPGNKERRKNYGKAGEYRLPDYGIEYRTLSNFWLRGIPLFSFVFGLARQAVNIVDQSTEKNPYRRELLSLVKMSDIKKAINNNDQELAARNFARIEDFILSIVKDDGYGFYPLMPETIQGFHKLVDDGIDHYFTQHPIKAWLEPSPYQDGGFHRFITQRVMI